VPLLVNVRIHRYTCSPIEVEGPSIRIDSDKSECLRAVERGAAVTVASVWGIRSRHEPIEGRRALRRRGALRWGPNTSEGMSDMQTLWTHLAQAGTEPRPRDPIPALACPTAAVTSPTVAF
jgi:hypothetical protein